MNAHATTRNRFFWHTRRERLLSAILWDVDGTLADTEEAHRNAFNRAFAASGSNLHWGSDLYRSLLRVTGGKERIRHALMERGVSATDIDPTWVSTVHALKTDFYTEAMACGHITLRPGILRLVAEARSRGIRQVIATTTSRGNVEALVQAFWSDSPFSDMACADTAANKKPAPDVYLAALQMAGVPPQQALAIEDSRNGVLAAGEAGITVVATPSSFTSADNFDGAACVLSSLGDEDAPAVGLRSAISVPSLVTVDWLQTAMNNCFVATDCRP